MGLEDAENFHRHFDEVERLVKRGYRRLLFERDLHTKNIGDEIPRTEEEFDRLPDPFDELRKRLRAVE